MFRINLQGFEDYLKFRIKNLKLSNYEAAINSIDLLYNLVEPLIINNMHLYYWINRLEIDYLRLIT